VECGCDASSRIRGPSTSHWKGRWLLVHPRTPHTYNLSPSKPASLQLQLPAQQKQPGLIINCRRLAHHICCLDSRHHRERLHIESRSILRSLQCSLQSPAALPANRSGPLTPSSPTGPTPVDLERAGDWTLPCPSPGKSHRRHFLSLGGDTSPYLHHTSEPLDSLTRPIATHSRNPSHLNRPAGSIWSFGLPASARLLEQRIFPCPDRGTRSPKTSFLSRHSTTPGPCARVTVDLAAALPHTAPSTTDIVPTRRAEISATMSLDLERHLTFVGDDASCRQGTFLGHDTHSLT
jgi:hypothetical protein